MNPRTSVGFVGCAVVAAFVGSGTVVRAGQGASLVPPETLQALLPVPADWTKVSEKAGQVAGSSGCDYTFAEVTYSREAMRVKITLADTGAAEASLMALAAMVISLPDDYLEKIPPATLVTRLKSAGFPAAERWDGAKRDGDLTVLVGGRFVASLEGWHLAGVETLRGMLTQIDLKKLAELK